MGKIKKIAIVGCVHGDEIIGKKVIKYFESLEIKDLSFFIAHPEALKENKRLLDQDLNRSFPGKISEKKEDRLAYYLTKELSNFDLVLDLHATNSNFDKALIVTSLKKEIKDILSLIPIEKVMVCDKNIFGGKDLISHVKLGISMEYGPNKTGENYTEAVKDIKQLFVNLGILEGKKKIFKKKEVFNCFGLFELESRGKFLGSKRLKDFSLIKKDEIVGEISGEKLKAKESFYPIFVGEGMYTEGFLMAEKKKVFFD